MEHVDAGQARSTAQDAMDRVAATASEAEREARAAAARAAERAKEMQERAMQAADEHLGKLRSYVEQNPLASAGIAFAAGVILSALLRR